MKMDWHCTACPQFGAAGDRGRRAARKQAKAHARWSGHDVRFGEELIRGQVGAAEAVRP